jgi:RNA polymerase sigma-70 factor, ECF subfamily
MAAPPANDLPDEELIQRAASDDEAACEALYVRYRSLVWRIAYAVVGRRHHADDASQEAWINIFRSLRYFKIGVAPFKSWIQVVALNEALDFLRRNKSRREDLDCDLTPADMNHSFLDGLSYISRPTFEGYSRPVAECLASLPNKIRSIVLLRDVVEMSGNDVADCFGIAPSHVTGLRRKGREALRDCLRNKGLYAFSDKGAQNGAK